MAPGSRIWYETESRECLETVGSEDCQLIGGGAGSDEPLGGGRVGAERESHIAGAMVSRLRSTSPAPPGDLDVHTAGRRPASEDHADHVRLIVRLLRCVDLPVGIDVDVVAPRDVARRRVALGPCDGAITAAR